MNTTQSAMEAIESKCSKKITKTKQWKIKKKILKSNSLILMTSFENMRTNISKIELILLATRFWFKI